MLSALASLYVKRHTNLQRPPGEIQFFDLQTTAYEKRLHQSEAELVRFTRSRGVISAALERDIALQKLGEADAAYRQIDQDRTDTERQIASLGEQLKSFPARSVTLKRWADNPEALEKMKTHLLELQLKRTELRNRFAPSYRLVQEVEQEIAETQASIAAEALTPVRDETSDKDPYYEWARMQLEKAQVQWDGLRARQSDAAAQVASLHAFAERLQSDAMDQQDLLRTQKTDEDNYLLYLHKREEARIGGAHHGSGLVSSSRTHDGFRLLDIVLRPGLMDNSQHWPSMRRISAGADGKQNETIRRHSNQGSACEGAGSSTWDSPGRAPFSRASGPLPEFVNFMGELTTSRVWDTGPKDDPSQYARMTLGTSALQPPRCAAVEAPRRGSLDATDQTAPIRVLPATHPLPSRSTVDRFTLGELIAAARLATRKMGMDCVSRAAFGRSGRGYFARRHNGCFAHAAATLSPTAQTRDYLRTKRSHAGAAAPPAKTHRMGSFA